MLAARSGAVEGTGYLCSENFRAAKGLEPNTRAIAVHDAASRGVER